MTTVGAYQIEIYHDESYETDSSGNVHNYDLEYFAANEYIFPTVFGIKVYENKELIKSAVIGSIGGGTTNHQNSIIFESNRILICCSNSVFCLTIPDLKLQWRTEADLACCFEIFEYDDTYIIHGEMEISRLDKFGNILWQKSGADIFVTLNGESGFELTDNFIYVTDFENRKYKFDYDGNDFTDKKQFR